MIRTKEQYIDMIIEMQYQNEEEFYWRQRKLDEEQEYYEKFMESETGKK